jgi:hypothetical protein
MEWFFNFGSRTVFLPDSSFLIIGGIGSDVSDTKNDVLQFYYNSGFLLRKRSMLEKRDAPAVLYRQGHVYAIGGKFAFKTWERYSIQNDNWVHLAPMQTGRHNAAVSTLQNDEYIYLIGGFALEVVGQSLERYSFTFDKWEHIDLRFPTYMLNVAIFQIDQNKIAILSGRFTKACYILEVDDGARNKAK